MSQSSSKSERESHKYIHEKRCISINIYYFIQYYRRIALERPEMPRGHYSTIKRRNRHSHTNKAYVVSLVTSFFQLHGTGIREKNHQRQAPGAGTKRIVKRNESVASMRSLSCALRRGVNDAQASKKCRRGITTITCDMIRTHRKQRTTLLQFFTKAWQNWW